MWRTSASAADMMSKEIRNRHLEFSKVISGKKSFQKRWEECVDMVSDNLPIATSALYIKHYFKKESREIALEMVDAIRDEFQSILKAVPWMDDTTKESALEKAKKMQNHIGYPNELMDNKNLIHYYGSLTVNENKYFESLLNISKFDNEKTLRSLRKPVNKSDWETHAQVALVNAFYNPQENSIRKF